MKHPEHLVSYPDPDSQQLRMDRYVGSGFGYIYTFCTTSGGLGGGGAGANYGWGLDPRYDKRGVGGGVHFRHNTKGGGGGGGLLSRKGGGTLHERATL